MLKICIPRVVFALLCLVGTWALGQRGNIPPELFPKILERNKITSAELDAVLPHLYPTVKTVVAFEVPEELENRRLAELGYVDVTAGPFKADPSGNTDSTKTIQAAADFARDHQMATFFPAGKYSVSDTLLFVQYSTIVPSARIGGAFAHANVLVGSTADPSKRAVIYLKPKSPGFTDPNNRKLVVHVVKTASQDRGFDNYDAGSSYNQVFRNIDIAIGEGNAGACGIRMHAAEGSSIQDVTMDMTHGHTGMIGAAGSGGSHHNLTVIGGRVGIDTRGFPPEFDVGDPGTQPGPTLSQITLIGQTESALIHRSRGPLIMVGWKMISSVEGPLIVNLKNRGPIDCSFSLIDSVIEFNNSSMKNQVISAERSYYLENVYVKNGASLDSSGSTEGKESPWIHYFQCAVGNNSQSIAKGLEFNETARVNGREYGGGFFKSSFEEPTKDVGSKHSYGIAPSFESKGACVVKDAPYNAKGDGVTDDTKALQRAIDDNEIVFLPKGYYRVTDTIKLKPNTKFIGVALQLSVIMTSEPFGKFMNPNNIIPLVETANDPKGQTYLAFIGIHVPQHANKDHVSDTVDCYALKWQVGRDSVLRSPGIRRINGKSEYGYSSKEYKELKYNTPLVQVTGNGGGKWYNFFIANGWADTKDFRYLKLSENTEPLAIYQLHAQHSRGASQVEAYKAASFTVYGSKSENNTMFMIGKGCGILHLYGFGGTATPDGNTEDYFEDNKDFLFTCFADQVVVTASSKSGNGHTRKNASEYSAFIDKYEGKNLGLKPLERPVLYQRVFP